MSAMSDPVWKPHATVAAIIEDDSRFLMVEEIADGQRVLNQPAGHLDPGESLIDAVIRETREESAWGFHPSALTGIYLWDQPGTSRSFLRFAFCGRHHDFDAGQTLDDGILRTVWRTREQLLEASGHLRSPLVMRCIDDYLAGKRYPLDMLRVIGQRFEN